VDAVLERVCEPLSDLPHVRRLAVADLSPARALQRLAADSGAVLAVVGSSHAGYLGRLHPGSTAQRLLHGAGCAVAVAPPGHRLRPHLRGGRVAVGFDGSRESAAALSGAAELAGALDLPLRVIRVFALARESEVSDYLVVGSRGYGPPGTVALGGVSGRVIRTAACPVIVVPNGVDAPFDAFQGSRLERLTSRSPAG
jgi:nucleotide-binding universal stress UspA family protein